MTKPMKSPRKPRIERFVRAIEVVGNRLPHPFTLFVLLTVIILVLSWILSEVGVSATSVATAKPGEAPVTVHVRNLLTIDAMRDFILNFVTIYADFPPLGLTMAMMLGIGVMEQSGLMSALMRRTLLGAPPFLVTAILALVGIHANLASDAGVIFTITIGAAIFKAVGRNPWVGIAAGYAAASGGFAANFLVAGTDVLLAGITETTAKAAGVQAPTHPMVNWYFMIAATVVVTLVVTVVTERFLSRYLGESREAADRSTLESHEVTHEERRGLRWAGWTALACIGLILAGAIPEGGLLRNDQGQLLPESPLTRGSVAILFFFFFFVGVAYGYGSRKIRSERDIPRLMEGGLRGLLGFLVVALPAAFFIHFFKESRLSEVLAIKGGALINDLDLGGLPLLLLFIFVVTLINLFLTSGSAKWLILAPIVVPMFAAADLSPAATQLAYRVGDSATNIISPIKDYLPVIIGLLEQYRQNEKTEVGIGTVISLEIVYAVGLLLALSGLLALWYLFGLPLGPGASIWM